MQVLNATLSSFESIFLQMGAFKAKLDKFLPPHVQLIVGIAMAIFTAFALGWRCGRRREIYCNATSAAHDLVTETLEAKILRLESNHPINPQNGCHHRDKYSIFSSLPEIIQDDDNELGVEKLQQDDEEINISRRPSHDSPILDSDAELKEEFENRPPHSPREDNSVTASRFFEEQVPRSNFLSLPSDAGFILTKLLNGQAEKFVIVDQRLGRHEFKGTVHYPDGTVVSGHFLDGDPIDGIKTTFKKPLTTGSE